MAAEGEIPNREDVVFIPTTAEDECDGPKTYIHYAAPWYSDMNTILMFGYLLLILLGGCITLTALVFTQNPWEIFVITFGFVALTLVGIFIKTRLQRFI